MHSDPARPQWLENWRLFGGIWNELHPNVPLLANYRSGKQWQQFDAAAPVGAAMSWCYVFGKDTSSEQALQHPVCIMPWSPRKREPQMGLGEVRKVMPGLPVWAWMPGCMVVSM